MADELHSFLDILADVAKQQEEEEKNKTQKSGDTESEEKTADRPRSTTATNEKSANDKNIKPAPQQEKDDPDFFNSAISNVKKNSRNSKKRNNSGEISIFDQISKNRKTGNTARRSTTRRSSARTGTAGRRRTSSRSAGIRVPSTNSIIKMILKALIDLIFGKKGKSTARKSSLSGTDVLNSLLKGSSDHTSAVTQNNLSGSSGPNVSQGLLESVVQTMFGNGKSSNAGNLQVFKQVVKSIIESDNGNALNDTASFRDTAAKLGYGAKESEDAAGILEGLLNSNLSNESIASVLEQFTESEDD